MGLKSRALWKKKNNFHSTIKFTAEMSNRDHFLGHKSVQEVRFNEKSILDVQTHHKPTETFQKTNFYSCQLPGVKKGFVKGEALRPLRINSSQTNFEENIKNFENRLIERGYPAALIVRKDLFEVKFANSSSTEKQIPT